MLLPGCYGVVTSTEYLVSRLSIISNTEYQVLCKRSQQEKDPYGTRQETHAKSSRFCEDIPAQTTSEPGLPPAEDSLGSKGRASSMAEKKTEYTPAANHSGIVERKHDF